jgi:hypothetical protein
MRVMIFGIIFKVFWGGGLDVFYEIKGALWDFYYK